MAKSDTFENDLLRYLFNSVAISGLSTDLHVALHTAAPGETGNQSTNEVSYTGYARQAVTRDGTGGWTVTDNAVNPDAEIAFPQSTDGTGDITHFSIGTAATGAGKILYSGALTSAITLSGTTTPILRDTLEVTES